MSARIFSEGFFSHIFHGRLCDKRKEGQTKPRPKVSGIHHEGAGIAAVVGVKVVEGTRSNKDRRGVYTAVVSVTREGLTGKKRTNFFPAEWTRTQVLEAIREVYEQKPKDKRPWGWFGRTSSGMKIYMLLDTEQRIISAWPERSYRKPCKHRYDARRRRESHELYREQMQAHWDALLCDSSNAHAASSVTV